MSNTKSNNEENRELGFFDLLDILISYKKSIIVIFLIFLLGSIVVANIFIKDSSYIHSKMLVPSTDAIPYGSVNELIEPTLSIKEVTNLNEIIKELTLAREIIQTLVLSDAKIVNNESIFSDSLIFQESKYPRFSLEDLYLNFYNLFNTNILKEQINNQFLETRNSIKLPTVRLSISAKTDSVDTQKIIIKFSSKDKDLIVEYSDFYLIKVKQLYEIEIKKLIQATIQSFDNKKLKVLSSLKQHNVILEKEFYNSQKEKLSLMREQAKIAREIGLDVPSEIEDINVIDNQSDQPTSTSMVVNSNSNYTYLRGYISIEKEIELINERVNAANFSLEIRKNLNAIETLEDKNFNKNVIDQLKYFDTDKLVPFNIVQESTTLIVGKVFGVKKRLFITVLSFLGIAFSLIYALFHYAYSAHRVKNLSI